MSAAVLGEEQHRAAVTFIEARRPEAATVVALGAFDGPLALLLSLVEQRQLDVLTVRLGDLAGAYLDAIGHLASDRLPHLSSFVGVASQLILIKSRAMLPRTQDVPPEETDEVADPEAELRARLLLYRRYRDAGLRLGDRLESGTRLFHREAGAATAAGLAGARPAHDVTLDPATLVAALTRATVLAPHPAAPPQVMPRTITLAERAQFIHDALRGASVVVLQDLLRGVTDRVLLAVTFLALLEMVKQREVTVEQAEPWGPIRCRRVAIPEEARS
ncbi:MAG: segregation/condensation protein A [Chloroflexi bacterium]|nr:segregation/condensation protein A [Chloroflexota bacterium]